LCRQYKTTSLTWLCGFSNDIPSAFISYVHSILYKMSTEAKITANMSDVLIAQPQWGQSTRGGPCPVASPFSSWGGGRDEVSRHSRFLWLPRCKYVICPVRRVSRTPGGVSARAMARHSQLNICFCAHDRAGAGEAATQPGTVATQQCKEQNGLCSVSPKTSPQRALGGSGCAPPLSGHR
jgi:hypothetical protein